MATEIQHDDVLYTNHKHLHLKQLLAEHRQNHRIYDKRQRDQMFCVVGLDFNNKKKTLHCVLTSVRISSAKKATSFFYEIQTAYNIRLINE
jgi:hypothetical protein